MNHAILLLTCGRIEETQQTWAHNLEPLRGNPAASFYLWDNSPTLDEVEAIYKETRQYVDVKAWAVGRNIGISIALNTIMNAAFEAGADLVTTMANDILEPDGYFEARTKAVETFPEAGVIAIPIHEQHCQRYPAKEERGIKVEDGHIIGNYTIPRATWEAGIRFFEGMGIYGPIDLDFCNQVWKIGKRCIYLSDLSAIHIGVNNPPEYQRAKDESLAKAWDIYYQRAK